MTNYLQDPAVWALTAGVPAAATLVVRQRRAIRALRQERQQSEASNADLRSQYAALEASLVELRSSYDEIVRQAKEEAENATKTVLKSAMRTLQGLAAEQQKAISQLQQKYGDSAVLRDMLDIDHMNSQFGRRAQSIAVLCQGWLGRQRDPASVYDVIRSAQGRIRHFPRVEILSQINFAVTSRAVEPVALAVAELLDNATSYSAPETVVEINVRTVPSGICIVIDDAGVGMNEEEKTHASSLLSGARAASVSDLGNPPQFGFAVIGALCARYDFSVTVDTASPYGGVRAVVLLPKDLLTSMPEPKPTAAPTDPVSNGSEPEAPATTADGLPKRRRKRTMSVVPSGEPPARQPARSSSETASILGAFQRGTEHGRTTLPDLEDQPGHADARKGPDAP
ncbi:ATP-binding protein [Streptomyces sp. NBC_01381]|uniref:ATP-binding protein n=1 Tax=Streptomyces sp. NBC_01381 TaxID=2903845 RepID=UPI00225A2382|nr:ATP-binding protein [Streptomyces sp. NBC_01381]MCX4671895.1 ATP-binding protein [Streptomyces sp. NBC_01381]